MVVDCVYRVAPDCSVIKGSFDLNTGRLVKYPDLYNVDITSYFAYYELNYSEYTLASRVLYNVMCKYPKALLAINYNNIGAIVVFEDKYIMYLEAIKSVKEVVDLQNKIVLPKARVIGIARSPILTFEVFQPLMYLAAVEIDDEEYILTEHGAKKLREPCDVVEGKPSGARYFEMCNTQTAIGNCSVNGKVELLREVGAWISTI